MFIYFLFFRTPVQCTKNSVVYEIISSLPLPAENSTLDSGADDLGPGFEFGQVGLGWVDPRWVIENQSKLQWQLIQREKRSNQAQMKINGILILLLIDM